MITIKHKFKDFGNKKDIQILILGTFNPDTPDNKAEFFYGRAKNYLWNLLPKVFGYHELKKANLAEKKEFIHKFQIGFADIIQEVSVENGQETNYADSYIDNKVKRWFDFESFISKHPNIQKVFLTRKSFADVPNMKIQIDNIKKHCIKKGILFSVLPTPARFENQAKLNEWKTIINGPREGSCNIGHDYYNPRL